MATATMTIRCDKKIKEEAAACAKYYGFDLTSVTRAFWTYLANNWSIPLTFGERVGEIPSEETIEAFRETERMLAGEVDFDTYHNAEEMFEALGI